MSSVAYMVTSISRTTRANTSKSTFAAPACFSARVETDSVAPVVNTSSTSRTRRPEIHVAAGFDMVNAPATLRRRARAERPAWLDVRHERYIASTSMDVPDWPEIAPASQADWLNPLRTSRA